MIMSTMIGKVNVIEIDNVIEIVNVREIVNVIEIEIIIVTVIDIYHGFDYGNSYILL